MSHVKSNKILFFILQKLRDIILINFKFIAFLKII